jgi:hypothetical protein
MGSETGTLGGRETSRAGCVQPDLYFLDPLGRANYLKGVFSLIGQEEHFSDREISSGNPSTVDKTRVV